MSVSVTDGQGLVVTAWARLEPQGLQPHHGSKLDTMYGEEEGTGGAEAGTVTAQTARVSSPPGAADLMIHASSNPAVWLSGLCAGVESRCGTANGPGRTAAVGRGPRRHQPRPRPQPSEGLMARGLILPFWLSGCLISTDVDDCRF